MLTSRPSMKSIIFFLLTVFLLVPEQIEGISCYVCDYGTEGCGRLFQKKGSGVLTSDSSPTFCTKVVSTSNINAIQRSYSLTTTCSEENVTTLGISGYQYCCSKNLCNDGRIETTNLIVTSICIIIILLLMK